MCLVAIAWKVHPRWRLLLAGNRDEFHARSTAPLGQWPEDPRLAAGRDLQSGGTWVGLNPDLGRCSVVTNVRDPLAQSSNAPSRGQLPAGFLRSDDSATRHAATLLAHAGDYAPFNALFIDADDCQYLGNHPVIEQRSLAPGIHGMSNGGLDTPWPKTRRLCEVMAQWSRTEATDNEVIWQALADERIAADYELPDTGVGIELERRLSSAFIRGPQYGTRACTLIAIDHQGRGTISERRFGPNGVFEGETRISSIPDAP